MQPYLLTILILLPAFGALALSMHGLASYSRATHYRWIALGFSAMMLALESAMIGVFVSLDLLLFFLFFELSLVPMFFLIGAWGGERRLYAAIKFYIYTAVGSLLMLAGIIWLWYLYSGIPGVSGGTFDYALLLEALQQGKISLVAG